MFIISNPTITGVYSWIARVLSIPFDTPVPGCGSSSLISHSTHNCDPRLVSASARGLTAPFLIWHQPPPGLLSPGPLVPTPPHLPWSGPRGAGSQTLIRGKNQNYLHQLVVGHPNWGSLHWLCVILKLCWTCSEVKWAVQLVNQYSPPLSLCRVRQPASSMVSGTPGNSGTSFPVTEETRKWSCPEIF